MRLANIKEFLRLVFTPESAPHDATIRRQLERGQIPGGTKVGSIWYVDLDKYAAATNLRADLLAQQRQLAESPRLVGLL